MTISRKQSCSALATYDSPVRSSATSPPGRTVQQDRLAVLYADKQASYRLTGLEELRCCYSGYIIRCCSSYFSSIVVNFYKLRNLPYVRNRWLGYRLQNSIFGGLILSMGRFWSFCRASKPVLRPTQSSTQWV